MPRSSASGSPSSEEPAPNLSAESVELSWARSPDADGCLSSSDLKQAVRRRLGRDPFAEPFQKQIEGYVSRKADKWIADLVVRDNRAGRVGSRRLESTISDCQELDQAVILTVTLIIDPNASLQPDSAAPAATTPRQTNPPSPIASAKLRENPPETPREPPKSESAAVEPESSEPPEQKSRPADTARTGSARAPSGEPNEPSIRLLLAPSVTYDLLPGLTPGVSFRAEIPLNRRIELEASATLFPERRNRFDGTDVGYSLTAIAAGACYNPNRSVALMACGSAWLGMSSAVVYEGIPDKPGPRPWGGLRTDVGVSAQSDRLLAELRTFGVFPISRWNFQVNGRETQFRQPFVAPGVEIAVGMRLP